MVGLLSELGKCVRMRFLLIISIISALVLFSVLTVKVSDAHRVNRVVIDVDSGIDDIEALVILINAEQKGVLKLEAIVVTEGNTGYLNGVRNVYLLLKILGRLDIPVYVGAKQSLLQHDKPMGGYYGSDGLGNLTWKTGTDPRFPKKARAYEEVVKLVNQYPNEVTYITLGPMTTLGMTIWQYPEVATKLKQVYAMGGLESKGEGEFNIAYDPESVDIVFKSLKSRMLLVTWQAGSDNSPKTDWYKNMTDVSNPAWNFMVRVQDAINSMLFGNNLSNAQWDHCDPIVPAVFLNPSLIKSSFTSSLQTEIGRVPSRGLVTNSTAIRESSVDVEVVLKIDFDRFLVDFVDAFKGICAPKQCQSVS